MAPAVAAQRQDDLGGKRDAGRFNAHQCGDAGVSTHVDDVRDELH
jgi:hypothetical protein